MRLPPLNALRAFEAAARHGGFVAAAEELCVTRGAVSRHVRVLEEDLGVPLFRRLPRGVELTGAGRSLLPALTEAFGLIAAQSARMRDSAAELRIICPPATSIRWLIPRLHRFRTRHPAIRLKLTTDFYRDRFDAAEYDLGLSLEHVPGRSPDTDLVRLFPSVIAPACAPDLAAELQAAPDLAGMTLLHETATRREWRAWAAAFPDAGLDPGAGDVFPNLDMAARAAAMGTGVLMADLVLCRDELDRGALVLPFPAMQVQDPDGQFCLLGRADRWEVPKVAAFRDWIVEEARAEAAALAAGGPGG